VNGALWAALSGVGFGIFQVLNGRAVRNLTQVYVSTFVQLLVATAVFVSIVAVVGPTGDLSDLPLNSLVLFSISGMLHFFIGWTTLNASQARIGAARTSPLIATTPIFGVLIAPVTTGSLPGPLALLGIAVTVVGAYAVTDPGAHRRAALRDSGFGLTTSAAWAVSAVLTVIGLRDFDDPLLGVTVSMAAAALAYGALLLLVPGTRRGRMPRDAWTLKIVAGVIVALATWWRWLGLADAEVGVVLALQLVTVPTVLVIVAATPGSERISLSVWAGSALVLAGVGLLIAVS
jgi:drug/metabolite transporter (DMT)-like permease